MLETPQSHSQLGGSTSIDQKENHPPPILPALLGNATIATADFLDKPASANGIPSPSERSNGMPQVPNGKPMPTSPSHVQRSNPMGDGQIQTVSSKDPKAAAAAASDMRNVVRRKLTGYVGFANLPNQWHRKSVRKGFNFNVMVVGELIYPLSFPSDH